MVGQWLANGLRTVGQWLANGWPMVGQWLSNGWTMVCHDVEAKRKDLSMYLDDVAMFVGFLRMGKLRRELILAGVALAPP